MRDWLLTTAMVGASCLLIIPSASQAQTGSPPADGPAATPTAEPGDGAPADRPADQGTAAGVVAGGTDAEVGDEIVITANRQEAVSLQRAPIAISVVNTEDLAREGGQGFRDILGGVPSFSFQETGPGQNKFNIRGLSATSFNQTDVQDRTLVSVYLDDTPISIQGDTPELNVFDLERVEVVRGPQGTLYGASAMAGNVRFISIKPDLDTFEATVEGGISGTLRGRVNNLARAVVNIPLVTDTLALRVAGYYGYNSGYIDNIGLGVKDANDDRTYQGRAVLRWVPIEPLTIDLSYTYSSLETGGEPTTLSGLGRRYSSTTAESYTDELHLANATIGYDAGPVQIVSSSSYTDRDFGRLYSGQYLVQGLARRDLNFFEVVAPNDIQNRLTDFNQEIRLKSTWDSRFNFIVGGFYQHQERDNEQLITNPGFDAFFGAFGLPGSVSLGAPVPDSPFYGLQTTEEDQWAVFGEVRYEPFDGFTLTAGARYFDWTQRFSLFNGGLLGSPDFANPFERSARPTRATSTRAFRSRGRPPPIT